MHSVLKICFKRLADIIIFHENIVFGSFIDKTIIFEILLSHPIAWINNFINQVPLLYQCCRPLVGKVGIPPNQLYLTTCLMCLSQFRNCGHVDYVLCLTFCLSYIRGKWQAFDVSICRNILPCYFYSKKVFLPMCILPGRID